MLPDMQQTIRMELENLSRKIEIDFVALALFDPVNVEIRWRLAYGALSDRYLSIAIRVGKGVAGTVLQTKRPMVIPSYPEDVPENPLEYPILWVEKLKSAVAVPVGTDSFLFGVLLVGQRTKRIFSEKHLAAINEAAMSITEFYSKLQSSVSFEEPKSHKSDSPLVSFLLQEMKTRVNQVTIELLDQRVAHISERYQLQFIGLFKNLLDRLITESRDQIVISIERQKEQQMVFEVKVNRRIDSPYQTFAHLIEKVGSLKGNVEMYNEPNEFRLLMNFSIGLLLDNQPWNFHRNGN
ncbi:GAF domain-containing protein [Microaerobacter geothermalis]|uniref:GAF domain-containing protein n=1 Tax=Microaerobacter geothermalis TaxID=674972 RepID=UPI001F1D13DF|nr:GAF domain-containing protein [Microaerobacter geothermalis]MCF6092562.1 GAF domain-containing protein [Microaerobacter geothermalis]